MCIVGLLGLFWGMKQFPCFFSKCYCIKSYWQKALYIFGNCIGNFKIGKNPYDLPYLLCVCIKGQIKELLHRTGHNPFFLNQEPKKGFWLVRGCTCQYFTTMGCNYFWRKIIVQMHLHFHKYFFSILIKFEL